VPKFRRFLFRKG